MYLMHHQSFETKCQVVRKMLVAQRHYVVMEVTLVATLATSVGLFLEL